MSLGILEWKNTAHRIALTPEPGEVSKGQNYHYIALIGSGSNFQANSWFLQNHMTLDSLMPQINSIDHSCLGTCSRGSRIVMSVIYTALNKNI